MPLYNLRTDRAKIPFREKGFPKIPAKVKVHLVAFLKTLTGEYQGKPVRGEVCPAP